MEQLIYIQVYKLEDEAIKGIEKLQAQGFRRDQISVLAYNTERFNYLFKPQAAEAILQNEQGQAVTASAVPKAVEDALTPDVVVPAAMPGLTPEQGGVVGTGYMPVVGLADFNLSEDALLSHERSLQDGDILVILQTDEGQEYRPDLPLISK